MRLAAGPLWGPSRGRLGRGSVGSLFLVEQASAHVHGHAHSDKLDASDRDGETALGVLQEVILASALAARLTRRYRLGARTCRRAALLFRLAPRLAVAVVERAFLGIAEDGVRLGDLLEVLGCCEVLGFCGVDVRVRVEGARKLSVDGLHLFRRRVAPEAQYSVMVQLPHALQDSVGVRAPPRTRGRTVLKNWEALLTDADERGGSDLRRRRAPRLP